MSLVELAVGLAIIGTLLALAAPGYSAWIQNTKIRGTAEAILNGLQLARTEAVRRNRQIQFSLVDNLSAACVLTTGGANWIVSYYDGVNPANLAGMCASAPLNEAFDPDDAINNPPPRIIQVRPSSEGSVGVTVAADQSSVVFNGLGRVIAAPANVVPVPIININVSNPAAGACASVGGGGGPMRCMRVTVSAGGQIRLCDPARANTDPVAC